MNSCPVGNESMAKPGANPNLPFQRCKYDRTGEERSLYPPRAKIHAFADRQENQPDTERSRDKTLWPQRDTVGLKTCPFPRDPAHLLHLLPKRAP